MNTSPSHWHPPSHTFTSDHYQYCTPCSIPSRDNPHEPLKPRVVGGTNELHLVSTSSNYRAAAHFVVMDSVGRSAVPTSNKTNSSSKGFIRDRPLSQDAYVKGTASSETPTTLPSLDSSNSILSMMRENETAQVPAGYKPEPPRSAFSNLDSNQSTSNARASASFGIIKDSFSSCFGCAPDGGDSPQARPERPRQPTMKEMIDDLFDDDSPPDKE